MSDTNTSTAPWYIIDASDRKWAELQVLETMVSNIEVAMQNQAHSVPILQNVFPLEQMPRLADIDLTDKTLDEEEYKEELKKLQTRLGELHNRYTENGFRSSSPMKAGMQQEKAAVMKYILLQARNPTRRQDIICGVSGQDCLRTVILQSLTEPGTAGLW